MTDRSSLLWIAGLLVLFLLWRNGHFTPGASGPPGRVEQWDSPGFDARLKEGLQPVIVDFYADWCGPCRVIQPLLAKLSIEYADRARFVKIDADRNGTLADTHKVTGIPCVILFKNGVEISRRVGALSYAEYEAWIAPHTALHPGGASPAVPPVHPAPTTISI